MDLGGRQALPRRAAHRPDALVRRRLRNTDPAQQVGVWQYCSAPSGAALEAFMEEYPYTDSPEPVGG